MRPGRRPRWQRGSSAGSGCPHSTKKSRGMKGAGRSRKDPSNKHVVWRLLRLNDVVEVGAAGDHRTRAEKLAGGHCGQAQRGDGPERRGLEAGKHQELEPELSPPDDRGQGVGLAVVDDPGAVAQGVWDVEGG
eukprot:CAMPEP_0194742826 /NCGR_PEP_ID=MMETSP0296-20130528/99974_1 /TAXON_ID=39354 /ORGANISM="Heterosigma akashiwo, Strain CCMP2393" /LENGTH=132 /DNA_ID=CAMNT_0039654795 /DNA_START=3836 /DNA_END=4235 /DNA_ORIENTATION=+